MYISTFTSQTDVDAANNVLKRIIPSYATFTIRETDQINIKQYLIEVTYTSNRTGRKITKTLPCDTLPSPGCELRFYTANLVLSPYEVGREFAKLAYMEKSARQAEFLSGGKGYNIRVSLNDHKEDMIPYGA